MALQRRRDLDDHVPLLLAISDNGTEMHANETRRFMALCSIAQHAWSPVDPDRPGVDRVAVAPRQREHPHRMTITDPAVLTAELERVRVHYHSVRLHEAIGYVTPNDEHAKTPRETPALRRAPDPHERSTGY